MVSQATVNAKVAYGFAKAAIALGADCDWYRPTAATAPISTSMQMGVIKAAFQIPNTAYTTPSNYAKPLWWGLFYTALVQAGDYLVDPLLGTYFVASVEPIHYPLCVSCNRVVTVSRPAAVAGFGAQPYSGDVFSTMAPLLTGWPVSLLNGTKGENGSVALPGDVKMPWAAVLMPALPGVTILMGDVLTDDLGRRFIVSAAELTGLGWRMTAGLATA